MPIRVGASKDLCLATLAILCTACIFASSSSAEILSSITLDNKSGQLALVKLQGPTSSSVVVPNSESRTVKAAAGNYYILVRYGASPGPYRYSRGEAFEVVQEETSTGTRFSRISITLHPVVSGNYSTYPSSQAEFDSGLATPGSTPSTIINVRVPQPIKIEPIKIQAPKLMRECEGEVQGRIEDGSDAAADEAALKAYLREKGDVDMAEIFICSRNPALGETGRQWMIQHLNSSYPPYCRDSYPIWRGRRCYYVPPNVKRLLNTTPQGSQRPE